MTYKRIILFSQDSCSSSKIIREFLSFENILFEEYNITKDYKARETMIKEYKSYTTPTVVVGEKVIRGFQLDLLEALLKEENAPSH
ncbi:glutaredoxin domain-containing protein [Calidifontibacillus oryziterrae]|uniref:glutaredoxin domain-containing protein n=1 Tax=Calidifontibacillus oryziterrae TaxID=1191699 RepID=UPI00036D29DD|nr:glutaredoxin domain-containing protein [Calidifontibacillus oryziterrae]